MFVEIYRCKMCGEKISKACVNDIIADTELLKKKDENRHFCQNGDMGIAEFIGFKRIDNLVDKS